MLANDNQRLNIFIKLANKFDYSEFKSSCEAGGADTLSGLEFAQKAGLLVCAMFTYPQLSPAEAYMKFIEEHSQSIPLTTSTQEKAPSNNSKTVTGCGSCGGGKVR